MLIVISGIDGCGKSTQVSLLKEWFVTNGKSVLVTKAYDDAAKKICKPWLDSWTDDLAIMFLFQALHSVQYAKSDEALNQGKVVIADRWDESYLAYHSCYGPLASQPDLRRSLNSMAFRSRVPDKGFLIEIPLAIAKERRESRGRMGPLEDRPSKYFTRLRDGYRQIAEERGWHIVDGSKTAAEIHSDILCHMA